MAWLLIILGLALLLGGGDLLVRGAVGIARKYKVPTLVIGLTIVSFGTSAPELMVSIQAAVGGNPDIAIGNVIGSNVANLGLVLGLTVLIFPILLDKNTLRIDWPVMMIATFLFWFFVRDLNLSFFEGLVFVVFLIAYIAFLFYVNKNQKKQPLEPEEVSLSRWGENTTIQLSMITLGCLGLVFGADFLVDGASDVARKFGVSDHMIGVTIVAFGTSVPELATSSIAAFKKQTDISVGNLIGSNIFNLLAILGITSMIIDIPVNPIVLESDIFWVLGISFVILPLTIRTLKLHRYKGVLLFLTYLVFMYLVIYHK